MQVVDVGIEGNGGLNAVTDPASLRAFWMFFGVGKVVFKNESLSDDRNGLFLTATYLQHHGQIQ